jgi:hypothetical protein
MAIVEPGTTSAATCVPCGGSGEACCGSEDFPGEGTSCAAPFACNNGTCGSCGGSGEACCAGGGCASPLVCGQFGQCEPCGQEGSGCCEGNTCSAGLACLGSICEVAVCPTNQPFTPTAWAPPTALHQNLCTAALISAYIASLGTPNGPFTSGNAACDGCLQTDVNASKHGPIVTELVGTTEYPLEINVGGCVADGDGNTAAGSCGNILDNQLACTQQECDECSDFSTDGPMTLACEQSVSAAGGMCSGPTIVPSASCSAELTGDGGTSQCAINPTSVTAITPFLTLWCGN